MNKESIENINLENQAENEIVASIEGEVCRHSIKGKEGKDPELTEEGIDKALEYYEPKENNMAFGSPKVRAQHTAASKVFGNIAKAPNLAETKEIIDADLGYGTHVGVDKRLDFNGDDQSEYGKKFYEAFNNGVYVKFLAEESDEYAKKVGDTEGSTCARMAGNIAQIFEKYYKAVDNWAEIVEKDKEKDKPEYNSNTLNRVLGTHQGVGESFLIKLIEKTEGIEKRQAFVEAVKNKGFDFNESFKWKINKLKNGDKTINFSFEKELPNGEVFSFNEEVSKEILDEIVEEGEK